MSKNITENLQLVMLPYRKMAAEWSSYYRLATECWEDVWSSLFEATNLPGPLFLDNLLRQDEAACIFTPTACVGLILFRTVNFSIMDFRKDSYFKEWDEQDLKKLLRFGNQVFVTSYLTVHPEFRNFNPHVKFKSVFLDIMAKRFLESEADVISGITRCDRGINDETYKLGAETVCANRDYLDGRFKVDLIAISKNMVIQSPDPHVRQLSDFLWKNRIDYMPKKTTHLQAA